MIDNPWHSRPKDVHRWSDHPEVKALTERVWEEGLLHDSEGGVGPKPKLSFRKQLRVLLLDLYVAWLEDPELSIGVSMSNNAWKTGSRYNALHLSKQIPNIIHSLHEVGLLELNRGSYVSPNDPSNRTTRIRPTPRLQEWFSEARFAQEDVLRSPAQEAILLKDEQRKRLVEYEDTEETIRMRSDLGAYNDLIASSFINIRSLEEPILEVTKEDGSTQSIWINKDSCRTYRVFSRGSWDLNGRFYGGWWQRINSELRSKICINDVPTIEVDFQGLHVAMLYAEAGEELLADPYELTGC